DTFGVHDPNTGSDRDAKVVGEPVAFILRDGERKPDLGRFGFDASHGLISIGIETKEGDVLIDGIGYNFAYAIRVCLREARACAEEEEHSSLLARSQE